jgi:hypothetical protein
MEWFGWTFYCWSAFVALSFGIGGAQAGIDHHRKVEQNLKPPVASLIVEVIALSMSLAAVLGIIIIVVGFLGLVVFRLILH